MKYILFPSLTFDLLFSHNACLLVSKNFSFEECSIVDFSNAPLTLITMFPADWPVELAPSQTESKLLTDATRLEINNCLVGGGLIFMCSTSTNDSCTDLGQSYFNQASIYIGDVWIEQKYRWLNLGAFWFSKIYKKYPNNGVWLIVVEPSQGALYEKMVLTPINKLNQPMAWNGSIVKDIKKPLLERQY